MKKVKYFLGALALLALASCKEDAPFLFNDVATLQFGPPLSAIYQSGANAAGANRSYTFFYKSPDTRQDTVFFDIYAIGGPSLKDRSFKLKQVQVDGVNNAIPGTHYIAFDNPDVSKNFVIKAGQVHSLVPVILLRDISLKTADAVLKFNIIENENFKLGETDYLWRRLDFTDRINKPAAWSATYQTTYYGTYSTVKHKFMMDSTGELWDQAFMSVLQDPVAPDPARLTYYMTVIKTALINYNNAHPGNALRDELGNLVVFP
ncbi:DUF4843 domain-containing protein [Solitalea koreensis]|uniref:DUF4843 domain-containing protein n=1 Tax=Solitalea koreensis TaxID=543615 RepID=A0A521AVF8_9SPHI|nr:DUF4843 domain-containing protein [Solitalea koreensis]SMO38795.1 protein of unknown function [Solitalea koreensis]